MRITNWLCTITLAALTTACQPAIAPPSDSSSSVEAASNSSAASTSFAPVLTQVEVDTHAAQFVAAIKSRDLNQLRTFYPQDYVASELTFDAPDPTFARTTLYKVVSAEPVAAKEVWNDGNNIVSILFYRVSIAGRIDDLSYLRSMYDQTLFVCNFDTSSDHWTVAHPILCYNETEGPFEDTSEMG